MRREEGRSAVSHRLPLRQGPAAKAGEGGLDTHGWKAAEAGQGRMRCSWEEAWSEGQEEKKEWWVWERRREGRREGRARESKERRARRASQNGRPALEIASLGRRVANGGVTNQGGRAARRHQKRTTPDGTGREQRHVSCDVRAAAVGLGTPKSTGAA
jgi:hypothetical protein